MRFSVDAHAVGQHLTGNETYIRNLLNNFALIDEESEFVVYVSDPQAASAIPDRFETRLVSRNPFVRLGAALSWKLRQDRPDLIHVQYTAPLLCPAPVVASVHDVSFLSNPEYFTHFRSAQLRSTVQWTVRSAARILTPSEFSRRAIIDAYRLREDKVVAIPNAVSSAFHTMSRPAAARWVASRFDLHFPFVLTVGDLQPRKNHVGLIRAFEELIRSHPQVRQHLLLVGQDTWYSPVVREVARKSSVADRIHFAGFVSDDELVRLYGACDLFVFPSFYEGFGLPILEAMACGRAVACSNTSAIPEVADSAALLFDPRSQHQMVRAMLDLLLDSELRLRMERLGSQNAARFSWERTARETLEVYYGVANSSRKVPVHAPASFSVRS